MTKSELKEIIKECLMESGVIEEPINEGLFTRLNVVKFIKGIKFDKKRESKKKDIKESYEVALYDMISSSDKRKLEAASDKASKKVYEEWKKKYESDDKDMLYYTYKGKTERITGYDDFFKIHKKAPTGSKVVDFDGYAILNTGVDPDTQYSGVGLDFESCVAKCIMQDDKYLSKKYYLSTEDYLGINIEINEQFLS